MKLENLTIFRITAGIVAAYHVLLGLLAVVGPSGLLASVADVALGIKMEPQGQVLVAARFAGCYMLAFGVMMLLLALKPRDYRMLVIPALVLFGVRTAVRLLSFEELSSSLGVSTTRNIVGIAMLLALFVVLLITRPRATS